MKPLVARAEGWLTPRLHEDADDQRMARLVARILIIGVLFVAAYTPVSLWLVPERASLAGLHLALLAGATAVALALRSGHVRSAAFLLVAVPWLHVSLSLWLHGGLRAPVLSTYFLVVLVAAMLFGLRGAVAGVAVCLAASLAVLVAESRGLLVPGPPPSVERTWAVFAVNLGLFVGFVHLALSELVRTNRVLRAEIEDRRLAERALDEAETRARSFLDSSPMGIHLYGLDDDGRLVLTGANPSADRILGIEHHELLGREIETAFPALTSTDLPERYRRICAEGGAWDEERFAYRDGAVRGVYQVHAFQTGPGGMATLFLDVTERHREEEARRQLEEQLRQSQKLEAVGRLAGGVAHDFNNLLMVITGHGELLRRGLGSDDPRLRKVQHMMSAADRASRLVRQLLAFSRSQSLEPRVVDLNQLVTEATRMLRPVLGADVSLTTDLAPGLGRVKVDRTQIEQVLMNLAVNARDAMSVGGTLSLRTSNVEVEGPGPVPPGRYVVLSVRDTGAGMDARTRSRIFEPFFTTKASGEGTGLGLAMAYGIVEQSGGHIALESEPGRGTAFHVHLPRVEGEVEVEAASDSESSLEGQETILVVEDEPSIRDLARELLEGLGYEVLDAASGDQALATARGHERPVDLALADVVMPGEDVRDLVRRLKHLHPEMRVLYMSGHGASTLSSHGIDEAGPDFLPKPFGQTQLARRVRQILDEPAPNRSA